MAGKTAAQRALELRLRNRRLPSLSDPSSGNRVMDQQFSAILEHLRMYEGDRGAPKERFVTLAELENAGLVKADVKQGFGYISQVLRKDVAQLAGSTTNPSQKDPVKKRTALEGRVPGTGTNAPNQGPISYRTGNAGGGGGGRLGGLLDVTVPKPAQNQFLAYSGARWTGYQLFDTENTWRKSQKFVNGQIIEGGSLCVFDEAGVNSLCLTQAGAISRIETGPGTGQLQFRANLHKWTMQDGLYGIQFSLTPAGAQVNSFGTGGYGAGNLTWVADDLAFSSVGIISITSGFGACTIGGTSINFTSSTISCTANAGALFDIQNGGELRIRNSADTDWGEFSHDGTDFNLALTNTTDWNITGGNVIIDNGPANTLLYVGDTANGMRLTGSDTNGQSRIDCLHSSGAYGLGNMIIAADDITWAGVGNVSWSSLGTLVLSGSSPNWTVIQDDFRFAGTYLQCENGHGIEFWDSTDADKIRFVNDGTDFNTSVILGTITDWNIDDMDVRIAQDVFAANLPDTKFKDADLGRSTTTLADDDDLFGWNLVADTWYKIEGWLDVTSNATADLKVLGQFSQTPQSAVWSFITRTSAASTGTSIGNTQDPITTALAIQWSGSGVTGLHLAGFFRSNATTGGTFDFQWAQNSASGTTTLGQGSWISITKMG